ncbi:hypothetical protein [Nocardiopsis synnemataformans]|uniref:hypothetical protein n=1 Tax=Nocardiopsis synnemataformans TaxID=61305 RepID=UPI003EC1476F
MPHRTKKHLIPRNRFVDGYDLVGFPVVLAVMLAFYPWLTGTSLTWPPVLWLAGLTVISIGMFLTVRYPRRLRRGDAES